jgi:hypothetical protein
MNFRCVPNQVLYQAEPLPEHGLQERIFGARPGAFDPLITLEPVYQNTGCCGTPGIRRISGQADERRCPRAAEAEAARKPELRRH